MPNFNKVQLGHGSGGHMMSQLINDIFIDCYVDKDLYMGDDATVLSSFAPHNNQRLVMSTDSFVVNPLFFPGGDIGKLAVCGTVNDVSTSGAVPLALSISFVLETGFEIDDLRKICKSIADTAKEANVPIITGDTKVVESGKADKIYINTTGIGVVENNKALSGRKICPGDVVLVSGNVGDHGICIMSQRESFNFSSNLRSDCAPLNKLIQDVLKVAPDTRVFRDPTRGGIASTLNEFAEQSNVDITINQADIPVRKEVKASCDILGLDVLHVANEGKMICVCPPQQADAALNAMKSNIYGKQAALIGYVDKPKMDNPKVYVRTEYQTLRILDKLSGEHLPRIC